MLDIKEIRDNPDRFREGLTKKGADVSAIDRVLELDEKRREMIQKTDALKGQRNQISKQIPQFIKNGEDAEHLKAQSKQIGEDLKSLDEELRTIEQEQGDLLMGTPNVPHDTVPVGGEDANEVLRTWGEKREFDFEPKFHWDIGAELGVLDLERGARISGSGFYTLRGQLARLERSLVNWMLDTHTRKNGYEEVAPPFLVNRQTMTGTGQLPKFEEDLYRIESEDIFLIPTAEVPVTNLYSGEILDAAQLPMKFCAFTPCFRREAGSYGKENRGISRVHQFNKVEMVQYALPEKSYDVLEDLTRNATELLEALGLHYRVLSLATGDLSFAAAKCYDLEIWSPGMGIWLEVSSCSNFEDFQARRANIRFRREAKGKPEYVHTLNGSGLALPRLLIALIENGQQADGSIALPPAIHDYFGAERIEP